MCDDDGWLIVGDDNLTALAKEKPGSRSHERFSRTSLEAVTVTFREGPRGCLPSGAVSEVQTMEAASLIKSIPVGIIVYTIAVWLVVYIWVTKK